MLNTININLKTDIKTDRPTTLPITLMSQDKNNNQFILRFTNGGESVNLDNTYTVEVLTKFSKSGTGRLTSAIVRQDYATWEFDTAYITQDETVYNYVYVRKSGNLVVSADANCFVFSVDLSEIDKGAGKVAETYDENYEKVLADYSGALDERTTERLDEAVVDFNQRGDTEIADWREYADIELEDYLADRVVLKNLVTNGDFNNGTIGWSSTGGSTTAESNILSLTSTGGTTLPRTYTNIAFVSGRKYYLSLRQRVTNSVANSLGFGTNASVNTVKSPIMNQWYENSVIFDAATDNQVLLSHAYADGATASGKVMQVKNVVLIDLTATFGVGNEPSKEWMDRLIEQTGYFDEHILDENWQVGEMLRLDDAKANKVQEDWITPTLLNGAAPGQSEPKYRKDEFGVVRLSGSVSSVSMNQTLFMLPLGYRPGGVINIPTLHGQYYNRYNDVARILASGNVVCWVLSNTTDNQNFSLDGITFVAEG